MKLNVTILSLIVSVLSLVGAEEKTAGDPGSRFAGHVERMLAQMTETKYQGQTEINEETGVLKCDCSGLMSYVLRHYFPEAYVSIDGEILPERPRPMAVTFYETFVAAGDESNHGGVWERVRQVKEVQPGDILAWRKATIVKGESSGHVLMIASSPEEESDGRFRVRVIDSTRGPHANDTRTQDSLGVGTGEMWLTADRDGELNGFYNNDKNRHDTTSKVAIGRIVQAGGESSAEKNGGNSPGSEDLDFIRLKTSSAIDLAIERGLKHQIIEEDGEVFPAKMRLVKDRVNFVIERGRVVRVVRG